MFRFDLDLYSPTVKQLLADELKPDRLCALGPGSPNRAARPILEVATPQDVAPQAASDELAACCLSGLWLWHDFLDESHQLSQDLHSTEGSYWHGIMHRREPDYSNAKYWYRRFGDHPIFPELLEQAQAIGANSDLTTQAEQLIASPHWDPYAFCRCMRQCRAQRE